MTEPTTAPLTEAEFINRFVDFAVQKVGTFFADGFSVADYANEVAAIYWADPSQRVDGPEACAESDIEYWGDN